MYFNRQTIQMCAWLICSLFILTPTVIFGQNQGIIVDEEWVVEESVRAVNNDVQQAIGNSEVSTRWINVEWCNYEIDKNPDENIEYVTTLPWDSKELCIQISNSSTEDVRLVTTFVDGTMTSNTNVRSCSSNRNVERFGQFITPWTDSVIIPALDTITLRPTMMFPIENLGEQMGCFTYRAVPLDGDVENTAGVAVIVRRVMPITAFVAGDVKTDVVFEPLRNGVQVKTTDVIWVVNNQWDYTVWFVMHNEWWLVQNVQVTWQITDTLGNTSPFTDIQAQVLPNNNRTFAFTVSELPRYKLRFTADVTITYQAEIGNIDPEYLTEDIIKEYTITETITFFVMPRWLIIGLVALILLIIIIKKIRHAQHAKAAAMQAELEELRQLKAAKDAEKSATDSTSESAPQ